ESDVPEVRAHATVHSDRACQRFVPLAVVLQFGEAHGCPTLRINNELCNTCSVTQYSAPHEFLDDRSRYRRTNDVCNLSRCLPSRPSDGYEVQNPLDLSRTCCS